MKILSPIHTSPETAYVVDDYPYGFTLRCKIRYWIKYKKNFGYRFCSQTTNPRKPITIWNAPKKGTYVRLAMIMYLDTENEHLKHDCLDIICSIDRVSNFLEIYRSGMNDSMIQNTEKYIEIRKRSELRISDGIHLSV